MSRVLHTRLALVFLFTINMLFTANVLANEKFANLSPEQSKAIIARVKLQPSDQFVDFLNYLLKIESINKKLKVSNAIKAYQLNKAQFDKNLAPSQQHILQRLLGLYSRIKYGKAAMNTLAELVAVPTFHVEGLEQNKNPEFIKIGKIIESIAKEFNLSFRNIDNRVFEISIKGESDEVIGIHAHADVVPVTPSLWVLKDGTKLNPFKLTRIGNRLYGRGSQDDKNGIVVSLYAMKVIQEEGLPLLRNFHLLVDTTEETSSTAMPYYFSRNPKPNYNFALDGEYPVVIAEKGYGSIIADFPARLARPNQDANSTILSVTGGLATNQIPAASVAIIKTSNKARLIKQLRKLSVDFVKDNGNNFSVTAAEQGSAVKLTVKGISAHSSEPWTGVNPVSRMFVFIDYIQQKSGLFKLNHITDAAAYISSNWGLDYYGKIVGINFSDKFMGALTNAVTLVQRTDSGLKVGVNLRIPVGRSIETIKAQVDSHLKQWHTKNPIDVNFETRYGKPMYRNPEGHWVNALLDVASENLSLPRKFGSSDGGTSVHRLPNGVQFGLAMPGIKYTGHNANEFKTVDQFLMDLQIVTEMFARIGQMPVLK